VYLNRVYPEKYFGLFKELRAFLMGARFLWGNIERAGGFCKRPLPSFLEAFIERVRVFMVKYLSLWDIVEWRGCNEF